MRTNPYSEHIKLARRHLKRLETAWNHMAEMSAQWDYLDGGLESDFNRLADEIERVKKPLAELMEDWKRGAEWD